MNVNTREAQIRDAPAIVRLILEHAAADEETSPITEAYVEEYLSSPISKLLLAETQGRVIGLLSYSFHPDLYHAGTSCLIEELIVQQSFRGRGIGSMLLTGLMSRLERMECAEVSVAAMPDNTDAIRLYRKHGLADEAVFLEKHFLSANGSPLTGG